jgi:acyl carrier protein
MTEVLSEVRRVAAEVFSTNVDGINAISSPRTIDNWDSIQHLNFVMALESRFNVQFSPEEMERIRSIGDAAALIARKTSLVVE